MVPLTSFEFMMEHISNRLCPESSTNLDARRYRMIGIVFAPPDEPLAKSEIVPQLANWHIHSGQHIDFFFAGYEKKENLGFDGDPRFRKVAIPGAEGWNWMFSDEVFHELRKSMQERTRWRYSGASDLLLTNAEWDRESSQANIDFTSTMLCHLAAMKREGAIGGVGEFFGSIFNRVESAPSGDPTWGFSETHAHKLVGNVLEQFTLALLPRSVATEMKRAKHFVVGDVGRR